MTSPAPTDIFHWNRHTRAFAGGQRVTPTARAPRRQIPASDTAETLKGLSAALGTGQPFMVFSGDKAPAGKAAQGSFMTLTGGSTGAPKVICRTQASWTRSFALHRDLFDFDADTKVAVLGRLSHSLALFAVLEAVQLGHEIHALDRFGPAAQATQMQTARCDVLYATPTQIRLLLRGAQAPFGDLRLVLCGGGALDTATRRALQQASPNAQIVVFYGAAETSFVTLSDAQTPSGSVGRAYPGVTLDLDPSGEVWVKSPYVFEGYASDETPQTRWRDGFISVGEIGHLDAAGYLFIKGRKDRMVTVAEHNVFLEEVEAVLMTHPDVTACAVLAQSDPIWGHRLIAVVEGAAETDLRAYARAHLEGAAQPRVVHRVGQLPTLASGKPDLRAIEAML